MSKEKKSFSSHFCQNTAYSPSPRYCNEPRKISTVKKNEIKCQTIFHHMSYGIDFMEEKESDEDIETVSTDEMM